MQNHDHVPNLTPFQKVKSCSETLPERISLHSRSISARTCLNVLMGTIRSSSLLSFKPHVKRPSTCVSRCLTTPHPSRRTVSIPFASNSGFAFLFHISYPHIFSLQTTYRVYALELKFHRRFHRTVTISAISSPIRNARRDRFRPFPRKGSQYHHKQLDIPTWLVIATISIARISASRPVSTMASAMSAHGIRPEKLAAVYPYVTLAIILRLSCLE